MNTTDMRAAVDTLRELRNRGVVLILREGQLRYKAPKGVLTEEDILRIRGVRTELADLLRAQSIGSAETASALKPRRSNDLVPLTYSQLVHWRKYRLADRTHVRQIASATRLSGPLSLEALRAGLAELERRHEALRIRIVRRDGVPMQEVSDRPGIELRVNDARTMSPSFRDVVVKRAVEEAILAPIDVTSDPLFDARLVRLKEDEHVLILTMEHIISDGHSRNILLRDLFEIYAELIAGRAPQLPAIPIQFADYALWQRENETGWLDNHRAYWSERLRGCTRLRFPGDRPYEDQPATGWGNIPVQISAEARSTLLRWCRANRTTLALAILAAYSTAALRWCGVADGIVRYEINGRVRPEVENTVGYFASGLNLRMALHSSDTLADVAKRVMSEYCSAYEHADHAWLDTQEPLPDYTRSTAFNWQPASAEPIRPMATAAEDAIRRTPLSFPHPLMKTFAWDAEPAITWFDTEDGVLGRLYFPLNRFSLEAMQRLGRNVLTCVDTLASRAHSKVSELKLATLSPY